MQENNIKLKFLFKLCKLITSKIFVNIEGIKTISRENITYELSCYVTGLEQLDKLIIALKKNSYVEKVERVFR